MKPYPTTTETKAFSTDFFDEFKTVEFKSNLKKNQQQQQAHEINSFTSRKNSIPNTKLIKQKKPKNEYQDENYEENIKLPRSVQFIEGKRFFKAAREKLPEDKFNLLLTELQKMNKNLQSREDTLEQAKSLLGALHKDLYTKFKELVLRK